MHHHGRVRRQIDQARKALRHPSRKPCIDLRPDLTITGSVPGVGVGTPVQKDRKLRPPPGEAEPLRISRILGREGGAQILRQNVQTPLPVFVRGGPDADSDPGC